jgi:kynurenine formamidase
VKVIDLTHSIHPRMPVYPGTALPELIPLSDILTDGFLETRLVLTSHTGTHLDAPAHMVAGGLTLDRIPAEKFIGSGWVCDVSGLKKDKITREDIVLPAQEIDFLLFYSGWDRKWNTPGYFEGYPVLSGEAVRRLKDHTLKGIGFDMISADPAGVDDYEVHTALLRNNVILIENLKNLDQLIGRHFLFSCLPLNITSGDGSPVRAVAMLEA